MTNSHMWLVAIILDNAELNDENNQNSKINQIFQIQVLQIPNFPRLWKLTIKTKR